MRTRAAGRSVASGSRMLASALAASALVAASPASAETLVTSLSNHRVLINSNYTGTSIAVFGAIERDAQTIARASPYDVVVTVRGPAQFLTVRRKERLGPVWLNQEQQKFPEAPSYLSVLSSRPLAEITSDALRARQKVGLAAVVNAPGFTNERDGRDDAFRAALLRIKEREGLYHATERGVTFLTPNLFRAAIPLPATAPPGNYDVDVMLFADSVMLSRTNTSFELVKTGFEQSVGEIAHDWSLVYGLATAALAILFGWTASVIFRRD